MCYYTDGLCGICGVPALYSSQPCPSRNTPGHQIFRTQTMLRLTITPYSCLNQGCPANQDIHHALSRMQASAAQKGSAYSNFIPFDEIKKRNQDKDEACHLALTPPLLLTYPPSQVFGAAIAPDWLSQKEWEAVATKYSQGTSILEIARLVRKNASSLRTYIDCYINKPSSRVPSLSEASSSDVSTDGSDLFAFDEDEELVPQPGMPHPTFLDRSERQTVFSMYQQNMTIKRIAETVNKPRYKISRYITAYMRKRLLKLQIAQRDAENQGTEAIDPRLWHQAPPVSPKASSPGTSLPEEILELNEQNLEAMLNDFINSTNPSLANAEPGSSKVLTPGTPRGDGDEDSLFGSDSPITAHHDTEVQWSKKRKNSTSEEQCEPYRPSKRLRHLSLP